MHRDFWFIKYLADWNLSKTLHFRSDFVCYIVTSEMNTFLVPFCPLFSLLFRCNWTSARCFAIFLRFVEKWCKRCFCYDWKIVTIQRLFETQPAANDRSTRSIVILITLHNWLLREKLIMFFDCSWKPNEGEKRNAMRCQKANEKNQIF